MTGPSEPTRTNEISNLFEYFKSIDWTEPWLLGLLAFHCTCLFLAISLRHYGNIHAALFLILLLTVYFSEAMNEWAANNWRSFSKEQYFDSGGLFISCIYSAPVLFNCLIIVVIWLSNVTGMMSEVHRKKLEMKAKLENKEKDNSSDKNSDNKHTEGSEDRKIEDKKSR